MTTLFPDPLFFLDADFTVGEHERIEGEEARHIHRVRRHGPGDKIYLTNGRGEGAVALLEEVVGKALYVNILEVHSQQVPCPSITLAAAVPRGERQNGLLGMATQLGMNRYVPLLCDRSVNKYRQQAGRRWEKTVVEACKQCRQCHFPEISEPKSVAEILADRTAASMVVVGDENGKLIQEIRLADSVRVEEIILLVGPEGGFSESELKSIRETNVLKLRLSPQILRTETAAIAILAAANQLETQ